MAINCEEPTLADILALGGTEDDIELLKDHTKTTKDISTGEINDFLNSIGLTPGMEMEEQDEETVVAPSVTKKKKSSKEATNETSSVKKKEKSDLKLHKNDPTTNSVVGNKRKLSEDSQSTHKNKRKKPDKHKGAKGVTTDPLPTSTDTESRLLSTKYSHHSQLLAPLMNEDSEMTPWFEQSNSSVSEGMAYTSRVIQHLYTIAKDVMANEIVLYKSAREKKNKKDLQWLKTVLSSGTLSDKMAGLTLVVQESPIHTLSTIDHFINMASKKGKREGILSIDTFKDLVIADLLPEDRKLKSLSQRPLHELLLDNNRGLDHHKLILWYYEDQLKERYGKFVNILVNLLHDPVAQIREKILGVVFDLLYKKPEQEQALLQSIVNKMGDPNRRIASKCILLLLKLLNHHVNMKGVVVKHVESLLYRPNLSEKAQYYAVCFLNQIVIAPADQELALKLVSVYFSFFKVYTSKEKFEAKILSAILTGVNRALPFLKTDMPSFEDHMNSLFKIAHVAPLATGIQSLVLLYQVMESRQAVSTRYYRALYEKLLDPRISLSSTQQAMFLNLLYKSLKNDPEHDRIKAFLKRILQTCSYHGPHFITGCLLLVSEVLKHNPSLWSYVLQSEGEAMEYFEDIADIDDEAAIDDEEKEIEQKSTVPEGAYSVDKREPLYCKAESSCLWELSKLSNHYHPTVQVFSKKIAQGHSIEYTGDPLNDFTLLRFLDQFMHKNPKKPKGDKGGSLMQPIVNSRPYTLPMSLNEVADMEGSSVREDLVFIHEFMKRDKALHKGKYSNLMIKKKKGQDESAEEISSESEGDVDSNNEDYAGELEKSHKTKDLKKKSKLKSKKINESDEDSEPSYSDMDESDFEDDLSFDGDSNDSIMDSDRDDHGVASVVKKKNKRKDEMDEAELEELLLDNLTSSEDDGDGDTDDDDHDSNTHTKMGSHNVRKRKNNSKDHQQKPMKKKKGSVSLDVFESVDKFAHLLNNSGNNSSQKQNDWEMKRSFGGHKGRSFGSTSKQGRGRGRGQRPTDQRKRGTGSGSSRRGGRGNHSDSQKVGHKRSGAYSRGRQGRNNRGGRR